MDDIDEIKRNIDLTQNFLYRTLQKEFSIDNLRTISFEEIGLIVYGGTGSEKDWLIDYFEDSSILFKIFNHQLNIKKKDIQDFQTREKLLSGRILAFKFNETLICGGSQQCSEGFFDNYNFPPVDTWIWIGKINQDDILLSWIPEPYNHLAEEGINCNPEGCIEWMSEWYAEFERKIKTT